MCVCVCVRVRTPASHHGSRFVPGYTGSWQHLAHETPGQERGCGALAGKEGWRRSRTQPVNPSCAGHGCHAGYEAPPAQELPCTAKGKGIFEVESPARDGSHDSVFLASSGGGEDVCSKPTGIFMSCFA